MMKKEPQNIELRMSNFEVFYYFYIRSSLSERLCAKTRFEFDIRC
jgi:hypothetical protein